MPENDIGSEDEPRSNSLRNRFMSYRSNHRSGE